MTMDILVERANGVLTIAFNRPDKKNAITAAMYQTMADTLADAQADASVRAILFRGSAGIFSAGNDLEDFMKAPPMGETRRCSSSCARSVRRKSRWWRRWRARRWASARRCCCTAICVYAADSASSRCRSRNSGLCPEAASSLLLQRVAGYQAGGGKAAARRSVRCRRSAAHGLRESRVAGCGSRCVRGIASREARRAAGCRHCA